MAWWTWSWDSRGLPCRLGFEDPDCTMMKTHGCLMFLLAMFSLDVSSYSVFLPERDASDVLRIRKRANYLFEELRPGNLERECYEEKCDFEEVKEIHNSLDEALIFWNLHVDGDQCAPDPCTNNATCQDLIGGYRCHCAEGFDGHRCQYGKVLVATNCSDNYGYCAHFCQEIPAINRRECSCASGYTLSDDGLLCNATGEFACGMLKGIRKLRNTKPHLGKGVAIDDFEFLLDPRITRGRVMPKGGSPWQVLLMNAEGIFICGGVLIHRFWVLTAAHCVLEGERFKVKLGEHNRTIDEETEDIILIENKYIHPNFSREKMDSDIALLRLSAAARFSDYILPVCLPTKAMAEVKLLVPGKNVLVTGWGAMDENDDRIRPSTLLFIQIKLTPYKLCKDTLGGKITSNMICAGNPSSGKDACKGDSGGPMVTLINGTWFLLGLVSWGEGCGRFQTFGVYTKVTNYLDWIHSSIN
ncbi:vitamin K-dependent protein C-like isoform X1 [Scyliorhinus torazame]|uniref:vitamin K-dependent protein C-like isoform X1 n=2 Tax=Scyliorhinus torazame TaxID=75743 RepID=UPI003B5CCD47